jgi:hypothetical protein
LTFAAPVFSQVETPPLDPERVTFVLGNVEFALLHELAHLVIGELDLPILGPEEQAADYLATMTLLRPIENPPVGREKWLEDLVKLKQDTTVVMRSCSMPEAAWVPEDRELIFCYELLDLYYVLSGDQDSYQIRSLLLSD